MTHIGSVFKFDVKDELRKLSGQIEMGSDSLPVQASTAC